jgi:integrase
MRGCWRSGAAAQWCTALPESLETWRQKDKRPRRLAFAHLLGLSFFGAAGRNRTHYPLVRRQYKRCPCHSEHIQSQEKNTIISTSYIATTSSTVHTRTLRAIASVGANVGAKVQGHDAKAVTALSLKALTAANDGQKIKLGQSMTGTVRADRNGLVSVHVTWRYRIGGKTREMRIGTWRDGKEGMSLKALRDTRDRLAGDLRNGIDPIEQKAATRLKAEADRLQGELEQRQRIEAAETAGLEQARRLTVCQLFDRWRATELQPRTRADGKRIGRKDGGQYVGEQFERHVFPLIGSSAAEDVRKADLLALLDVQTSAGKLRTANVLLADLKQMFDFALERDLIVGNPLATVKKSKVGGANVERDRVLSEDEVSDLASALPNARMNPRSVAAIWLTLATGVRVGELMGAVWADALPDASRARQARLDVLRAQADAEGAKLGIVDTVARTWHLPDTKNQRNHTVHLSDFALSQFAALARLREVLAGDTNEALSPWVFPATDNHRPVCIKSFGKQLADRQREPEARMQNRSKMTDALSLSGGKWTAHDLRRSCATMMARLGFASDTINECLNHKQADRMAKVYIHDRREADQQRAFDALGARLGAILNERYTVTNVIPLRFTANHAT